MAPNERQCRSRTSGFTLIELMVVVAVIGILSAIAIPKFAVLLEKSREGTTKGNLGRLRSVLNIYYSDMEGYFPISANASNTNNWTGLSTSLVPKYLDAIPKVKTRHHAASASVYKHSYVQAHSHDSGYGYWGYDGTYPTTQSWGQLWIWCTHTDDNGARWSTF